MATNIVLKRSATADAAPTTSDLELGELALNTYDGKLYMKKTVNGSSSIVNLSGAVAPTSSAFSHTTYKFVASGSTTTFTGSDADSKTLSYTAGQIQVFLNGILLDASDYTASNGSSVVLGSATGSGSILYVISFEGTNPFDYFKYTASSGQTSFSGNDANSESLLYTVGNIAVYLNGVLLDATDYTATSGTSVVLASGATSGDILTVWEFNETGLSDLASDTSPQLGGDLDVVTHDIVSTSNRHIDIIPHGTGNVTLQTDTVQLGSSGENVTVTTNSTGDLTLNTNSGTNSGSIVIADGANNNITLTPNGSGNVVLDNHTWPAADGSANQVLQTNGSGVLSFTSISSSAITDTDGNTKIQVEEGSDDDTIRFDVAGTEQIVLVDGVLRPTTDNDIDLGTSSIEFKDAYFDGTVTSDAFAGPLTGNVTGDLSGTATLATSVTVSANNSTDETVYPVFVDGATGTQGAETDTGLSYNPSSGALTSTTFIGALTGNANTATTATTATNVTASANNSTDETVYPTFVDGATGGQGIETDTGLTYNPSSGIITATQFTGAVVGNVTGNASGTAATVTTAAQPAITSVGTLTTLTVDNVIINGTTIGHTGDTDLMTLASGVLTVAGDVYVGGSNKELRFYEGSNYVGFEAPALSANQIWVLPNADGSANQTLKTDGSGNLSWATAASAVSNLTDVTLSSLASNDYLRYNGSAWVNTSQGSNPVVDTMTGDNSDTTLTLSQTPLHENATLVTIDGVVQHKSTYSVSGNTLTFSTAPPTGSAVECITNVNTNILNGNDVTVDTMTGDNSDTTLSLSVTPTNENHVNVYWDGVYQHKDNWSLSGTTITFDTAPGTGVKVEAVSNQMMSAGTATDLTATAISGKTLVTAVGADHLLVYDATDGALKKALVSDVIEQATTEEVQDIVGAMFSSNTETGITATYEDGDGTIDLVVGTLNQDTTGTADNITVSANNSTDETVYPIFVDGATGSQGAESDTGLTYNPSTGVLTSTSFTGNVTGNVTGNTSGTAATVTGAAQSAITSVGTLTSLTVSGAITASSVNASAGFLNGANGGIRIHSGGTKFFNITAANAARDNHMDIGASDARFKDLHIGGSIVNSGNITLDTAADIILDAGGADITFNDDGTTFGQIRHQSGDFSFQSSISDKDIKFIGNDGGSDVTALTLDMSDAGKAIFGGDLQAPGIYVGSTNTSYDFYNNGTSYLNGAVTVDDDLTMGGDIIRSGSSDLTIDVGGRINLSADDNGEVRLYDGSSLYAQFKDDDDRLSIQGLLADKDMMFVINDGGTATTAMKLDAASGGDATFYGTLGVASTIRVTTDGSASAPCYQVGGDADTGMYQPAANQLGFTVAGTQKAYFTTTAFNLDSSVTSGFGLSDNVPIKLGNSGDFKLYHDGSNSYIEDAGVGNLYLKSNADNYIHLISAATDANLGFIFDNHSGTAKGNILVDSDDNNMSIESMKDITYKVTNTNSTAGHHIFKSYNTEIMRIDGGNNTVLIGGTTAVPNTAGTGALQVLGTGGGDTTLTIGRFSANSAPPTLAFTKSRHGTIGSNTIVADGDNLGQIIFSASDGTDMVPNAAKIECEVDGTPGANDMPGRLVFFTTADGSDGATERMRIASDGNVGIGTTQAKHPLHVYLTNGELAHFGSNQMNSVGTYAGIGLGQCLANNTTYQKIAIVAEGRDSGNYISNLHLLVDTAGDGGSAVLADKKFSISGGTGLCNAQLGITFGDDDATANALDDYEEGTWTPAIYTYSGVTTSSISTYGIYTKIGNICHIHAKITVTLSSLPGQIVTITGLPFTATNTNDTGQRSIIAIGGDSANLGSYANGRAHFRTNGAELQGVYMNSGSTAYWNYNGMDSSTWEMHVHGHYTV